MKKEKRKNIIKAYLADDEYAIVLENSKNTRLSLSAFVRNVCTGARVESRADAELRYELRRIKGDLARLGGLFKHAILEDNTKREDIRPLLKQIEDNISLLGVKIKDI